MFIEERNALSTSVKPQRYTQCVLVDKSQSKHNFFFVYMKTPKNAFKLILMVTITQPL